MIHWLAKNARHIDSTRAAFSEAENRPRFDRSPQTLLIINNSSFVLDLISKRGKKRNTRYPRVSFTAIKNIRLYPLSEIIGLGFQHLNSIERGEMFNQRSVRISIERNSTIIPTQVASQSTKSIVKKRKFLRAGYV